MASCENCWRYASFQSMVSGKLTASIYERIIKERNCTPEEQAGPGATRCMWCRRRRVHEVADVCMNGACALHGRPEPETSTIVGPDLVSAAVELSSRSGGLGLAVFVSDEVAPGEWFAVNGWPPIPFMHPEGRALALRPAP